MKPELLGEKVCVGSQRRCVSREVGPVGVVYQWTCHSREGWWSLEEEWLQQPVPKRAMIGGNGSGGLLLGSGP